MAVNEVYIDIRFPIRGSTLPVDHGYLLFSAVANVVPELHGSAHIGIHPISGVLMGNRLMTVTPRSALIIRARVEDYRILLPLSGRKLRVGEHTLCLGVAQPRALEPSPILYSRLVVIKGFMNPETFLDAVRRQMEEHAISGSPSLICQPTIAQTNAGSSAGSHSPVLRRTVRVRDKTVVGFAMKVTGLSDKDSIALQCKGIGGRRRFGCGVFVPVER